MNRQPSGLPTGGQFSTSAKAEVDVDLTARPELEVEASKADRLFRQSIAEGAASQRLAADRDSDRLTSRDADEAYRESALYLAREGLVIKHRLRNDAFTGAELDYQNLRTAADHADQIMPVIGYHDPSEGESFEHIGMVATPISTVDEPDAHLRVALIDVRDGSVQGAFTMPRGSATSSLSRAEAISAMQDDIRKQASA